MFNQVISAYGEPKFILGLYDVRAILKTAKINQVKPGVLACTYNPSRAQGQP